MCSPGNTGFGLQTNSLEFYARLEHYATLTSAPTREIMVIQTKFHGYMNIPNFHNKWGLRFDAGPSRGSGVRRSHHIDQREQQRNMKYHDSPSGRMFEHQTGSRDQGPIMVSKVRTPNADYFCEVAVAP